MKPNRLSKGKSLYLLQHTYNPNMLIEFSQLQKEETIGDEEVNTIANKVLSKHKKAFEELAKCNFRK